MNDGAEISIKVIGVGGCGCNAISRMHASAQNAHYLAINTDAASLKTTRCDEKLMIGKNVTRLFSAGGDQATAERATMDDIDSIKSAVSGVDLIFLVTGLGGATGSATAPIIAKCARLAGAKVIAFCAIAFEFEGSERAKIAKRAIQKLRENCDIVIATPNDAMLTSTQANIKDAFDAANECTKSSINSICAMLGKTGLINIDFGALKNLFASKENCAGLFAYGEASGENCHIKALENLSKFPALNSPYSAKRADKLIVSVRCGEDMPMIKLKETLVAVAQKFSSSENVLFGAIVDAGSNGKISICALGIEKTEALSEIDADLSSAILELPSQTSELQLRRRARERIVKLVRQEKPDDAQSEFGFVDIELKRGFFEDTPPSIYGKEDLDVPTFMRRKIKIALKKS